MLMGGTTPQTTDTGGFLPNRRTKELLGKGLRLWEADPELFLSVVE